VAAVKEPDLKDSAAKDAKPAPPKDPDQKSEGVSVRVVPGIARYHKGDCLLIRFLADDDLEIMSLAAATSEGYVPCKACKPDQPAD
jgi:hypothetical protein